MKKLNLLSILALVGLGAYAGPDSAGSIIFINEDWYGHRNSTINILKPDDPNEEYWSYRVIQEANPGKELGCTNQFGAIFRGRLYLIAKQDKDPGAEIAGGRITVADAHSFKIIRQLRQIDPSGSQCDGRAFLGVNEHKGYVSSSNGIWVLNLDDLTVSGQITGSGNPNVGQGNDLPPSDPTGSLYLGQSGTMVMAENKVFAVHQQFGVLVIDPESDSVIDILSMEWATKAITDLTGTSPAKQPGVGSTIIRSKDGMLWHSLSVDDQGLGSVLPYIVKIDPTSLERELIPIDGENIYAPGNSWYAWTPDPFCASANNNELFWCGGSNRWFSHQTIYRFNTDTRITDIFADLRDDSGLWKVYGCSMGIDPITDEIYASLYHDFQDPTYLVRRFSSEGEAICDYPMISHYWFPSHPIFLNRADLSEIPHINHSAESASGGTGYYDLTGRYLGKNPPSGPKVVIKRSADKIEKLLIP